MVRSPAFMQQLENAGLRTYARPVCPICGASGRIEYASVRDLLFGVQGSWDIRGCADSGCGCLWLDPCPVPEDIGKAYVAYYTHVARSGWLARALEAGWALAGKAYLAAHHRRAVAGMPHAAARVLDPLMRLRPELYLHLALLLRHLPPPAPGQTLLDIGCGEGLALKVLERVGWQAQGQDIDGHAVSAARSRGLTVSEGTLESCAFETSSFDAVTMSHVIEHVHDPRAFLREILRILKPGGTLVSVTPNVRSENHERFGRAWRGLEPPRHLTVFTPEALGKLARDTGFSTAQVTSSVRANRFSEIAGRGVMRSGAHRWDDAGTPTDRVVSKVRFYRALARRDGERLRGDELILSAKK